MGRLLGLGSGIPAQASPPGAMFNVPAGAGGVRSTGGRKKQCPSIDELMQQALKSKDDLRPGGGAGGSTDGGSGGSGDGGGSGPGGGGNQTFGSRQLGPCSSSVEAAEECQRIGACHGSCVDGVIQCWGQVGVNCSQIREKGGQGTFSPRNIFAPVNSGIPSGLAIRALGTTGAVSSSSGGLTPT